MAVGNASFAERLAYARSFVAAVRAGRGPQLSDHLVDQLDAASVDAFKRSMRFAGLWMDAEPDRNWIHNVGEKPIPDDADARVLAAVASCRPCFHLRRGPQPAWAFLAFHRLDCVKCCGTARKPPAGEEDRCDWCGEHGITAFKPIMYQRGPLVVIGDACSSCAPALSY